MTFAGVPTHTHKNTHIRYNSSGRVIGPSQRTLRENKKRSQQTDVHAPGGIRTRSPSKREAADKRLRPRGQ